MADMRSEEPRVCRKHDCLPQGRFIPFFVSRIPLVSKIRHVDQRRLQVINPIFRGMVMGLP